MASPSLLIIPYLLLGLEFHACPLNAPPPPPSLYPHFFLLFPPSMAGRNPCHLPGWPLSAATLPDVLRTPSPRRILLLPRRRCFHRGRRHPNPSSSRLQCRGYGPIPVPVHHRERWESWERGWTRWERWKWEFQGWGGAGCDKQCKDCWRGAGRVSPPVVVACGWEQVCLLCGGGAGSAPLEAEECLFAAGGRLGDRGAGFHYIPSHVQGEII